MRDKFCLQHVYIVLEGSICSFLTEKFLIKIYSKNINVENFKSQIYFKLKNITHFLVLQISLEIYSVIQTKNNLLSKLWYFDT